MISAVNLGGPYSSGETSASWLKVYWNWKKHFLRVIPHQATFYLTCLLTLNLASFLAFYLTFLLTFQLAFYLTLHLEFYFFDISFHLTFALAFYRSGNYPDIPFGIVLDMLFGILFWRSFCHLKSYQPFCMGCAQVHANPAWVGLTIGVSLRSLPWQNLLT